MDKKRLGLILVLLLIFTAGLGLFSPLRGVAQAAGPHLWLSQKVGHPLPVCRSMATGSVTAKPC